MLVAADPLAAVAAEWRAMWEIPREVAREPRGAEAFELRAAVALAAWRAGRFELPDYYLALAPAGLRQEESKATGSATPEEPRPDFYLGPLRSVRPHRVAVVAAAEPAEQAAGVLSALGSLRHGRWWPPLEEVIDAARRFYPALSPSRGPRWPRDSPPRNVRPRRQDGWRGSYRGHAPYRGPGRPGDTAGGRRAATAEGQAAKGTPGQSPPVVRDRFLG